VILVSHRPNILRDVDHLLMLKAGAPALMKARADLQLDLSSEGAGAKTSPRRWAEAR
jgi:ABC-type protease/lipase transport system fused ATPase/permease subunit